MQRITLITTALSALLLFCGCASYRFTSNIPVENRTIAVPVFENESGIPELDAIITQYTLREFQREGTFKITGLDNAAYKLYGTLKKARPSPLNYDRNFGSRASEYDYKVKALITLVETSSGKMLMTEIPVTANTSFLTQGDMLTGMQDANPRLAKELSRVIVDTVLAQW
ncbi:MAG: LPS assembly lipoprotein LptE [Kiritimatiellia bacterium]